MATRCSISSPNNWHLSINLGKKSLRKNSEIILELIYLKVFVWDDEMDSLEFSSIAADPTQAKLFRTATIEYIRACLDGDDIQAAKISSDPIITSFKPVGDAVVSSYTNGKSK